MSRRLSAWIDSQEMPMLRWLLVLSLLLSANTFAEASPRPRFEIDVTGAIEIGPEGTVIAHSLEQKLTPTLRGMISKHLAAWRFEPIEVNGRPVIAKTRLRLQLEAEPGDDDNYRLTIRNVWFGEPERSHKMAPPRYPRGALVAEIGAKVLLVLKLDADGKVSDAFVRQTNLTRRGKEQVVERWRKVFERVSLQAARRWRFTPGEQVNGVPVEATVAVPVQFSTSTKGDWGVFYPGPVHAAPWPDDQMRLADAGALESDEIMPLGSSFKLETEVIGKVL